MMVIIKIKFIKTLNLCFLLLLVIAYSCSNNDEISQEEKDTVLDASTKGSGVFSFTYKTTNRTKVLDVYYHIPQDKISTTPILIVFHGVGRNAEDYRNAMIEKADALGYIVITPQFSQQNFPRGDGYNLGNVFVDGDNPSSSTLNPEADWAFSIVEPLFDFVRLQVKNTNATYNIFGHSAGGQFAHRFIMFKPNARVDKVITSASGWYTFPDVSIPFPYGFDKSPLENMALANLFSKHIYVQVGENDNDPNASSLRHNDFADAQGLNRKERAINFFQYCQQLAQNNALPFNWSFHIVTNAEHNYILASKNASDLIFN